jgi:hypothetical protein
MAAKAKGPIFIRYSGGYLVPHRYRSVTLPPQDNMPLVSQLTANKSALACCAWFGLNAEWSFGHCTALAPLVLAEELAAAWHGAWEFGSERFPGTAT